MRVSELAFAGRNSISKLGQNVRQETSPEVPVSASSMALGWPLSAGVRGLWFRHTLVVWSAHPGQGRNGVGPVRAEAMDIALCIRTKDRFGRKLST